MTLNSWYSVYEEGVLCTDTGPNIATTSDTQQDVDIGYLLTRDECGCVWLNAN